MAEIPEYIALINPVPGLSDAEQRRIVAKFSPADFFVPRKDESPDRFIRMLRSPRVVVVSHVALLGEQRGKKLDRCDSMAATKTAIHKRGTYIVEASTGRRSDKAWAAMRKGGEDMCGRLAQGAKSVVNGLRGTAALADQYNTTALRDLLRVRHSNKYPNWRSRRAAIVRLGIKPVPGRTWFVQHLENVCRRRGILE